MHYLYSSLVKPARQKQRWIEARTLSRVFGNSQCVWISRHFPCGSHLFPNSQLLQKLKEFCENRENFPRSSRNRANLKKIDIMTGRGGTGGGLRAGVADPKKISGELFRYSVYFLSCGNVNFGELWPKFDQNLRYVILILCQAFLEQFSGKRRVRSGFARKLSFLIIFLEFGVQFRVFEIFLHDFRQKW